MSGKQTVRTNLLLLAATCTALVLLVEIAFRFVVVPPPDPPCWQQNGATSIESLPVYELTSDPLIPYRLRPDQRERSDRTGHLCTFSTNSHGMRSGERSVEKPPGTWRVLFVGDSVTEGTSLSDENVYVSLVDSIVNSEQGGVRIETLNMAVGGSNLFTEKQVLFRNGLRFDPDLVVLATTLNDYQSQYAMLSDAHLVRLGPIPADAFATEYDRNVVQQRQVTGVAKGRLGGATDADIDRNEGRLGRYLPRPVTELLRASAVYRFAARWSYTGSRPLFWWEHPYYGPSVHGRRLSDPRSQELRWMVRQIAEIADTCGARDVPLLVALFPLQSQLRYDGEDAVQANLRNALDSLGVAHVDLLPVLRSAVNAVGPLYLRNDNIHPSPVGNRVIADTLAKVIRVDFATNSTSSPLRQR